MKDLENINNLFPSGGKKLPFEVPVGYFDSLPTRIQERCILENAAQQKRQPFSVLQVVRNQLILATGFVALAIIASIGYFYLNPSNELQPKPGDDYIEIVQKSIIDSDQAKDKKKDKPIIHLDSLKKEQREEVIKYLIDEDIDYVTLIEQY